MFILNRNLKKMKTPVLGETLSVSLMGRHATPMVTRGCLLIHQCNIRDAMPHHWSPGDLLQVLRI